MGRNSGRLLKTEEGKVYLLRDRQLVPNKVMVYLVDSKLRLQRDENDVPVGKCMTTEEFDSWASGCTVVGYVD